MDRNHEKIEIIFIHYKEITSDKMMKSNIHSARKRANAIVGCQQRMRAWSIDLHAYKFAEEIHEKQDEVSENKGWQDKFDNVVTSKEQ